MLPPVATAPTPIFSVAPLLYSFLIWGTYLENLSRKKTDFQSFCNTCFFSCGWNGTLSPVSASGSASMCPPQSCSKMGTDPKRGLHEIQTSNAQDSLSLKTMNPHLCQPPRDMISNVITICTLNVHRSLSSSIRQPAALKVPNTASTFSLLTASPMIRTFSITSHTFLKFF